jgi:hypothetical protein
MTATVRLQPLAGQWETLGADRLRGLVAENIEASSNEWGPEGLSFTLRAEEGARRPDLLPFTPVELEVDGMLCWAGFVWQRPSDANGYTVGCKGWQYHLDDDLFDRAYVHYRTSDWRDARSYITTDLTARTAGWSVNTGEGQIILSLPPGVTAATGTSCSVVLDLGPDSVAKRVVVQTNGGGAPAGWNFHIRGASSSPTGNDENTNTSGLPNTTTYYNFTFTTPRRYVELLLSNLTGAPGTGAAETWIVITTALIVRDTAYESGNASILKADSVIKDALSFAPLLNQSVAMVSAGTFSIPMYVTGGYVTPRSVMEAVNAIENYRLKIGGVDLRTLVYDAKPSAPIAEVGEWSGAQFTDASVSGEPIYSRAIVDGSGPDSARLVSKRTQTGTLVDRRSFTRSARLDISAAVTSAVADRIADLYLTEHKTAPFSGTLRIVGSGARNALSGTPIAPHEFLLYAGEKVRLSNRLDPDTGAWGRDGRIAGITYRHNDRAVEIAIDDQRHRFETILSRYAALVG